MEEYCSGGFERGNCGKGGMNIVIGCLIVLDSEKFEKSWIEFYVNGESCGVAFDNTYLIQNQFMKKKYDLADDRTFLDLTEAEMNERIEKKIELSVKKEGEEIESKVENSNENKMDVSDQKNEVKEIVKFYPMISVYEDEAIAKINVGPMFQYPPTNIQSYKPMSYALETKTRSEEQISTTEHSNKTITENDLLQRILS